jgi:hypothetical protein
LADHRGLPSIEGGAVRRHFQQGKIDDVVVEDCSVPAAGDGDDALLGVEDALGGVEAGASHCVYRRSVDSMQRARFFHAVSWSGQGY